MVRVIKLDNGVRLSVFQDQRKCEVAGFGWTLQSIVNEWLFLSSNYEQSMRKQEDVQWRESFPLLNTNPQE